MNCSSRALAGCNTGRFNCWARILTAEGWDLRSRPLGLSGWVTTAGTENRVSPASFLRLAQDNSAVPMKTTRIYDLRFTIYASQASAIIEDVRRSIGPGCEGGRLDLSALPV